MSDVVLELSLSRSSGVLAGIVNALAQSGLELQSQKLDRDRAAREGARGWLTIHARGDAPDPAALAQRLADHLASARGVDRIVRAEIDGEPFFTETASIGHRTQADDRAAVSTGTGVDRDEDAEIEASDSPERDPVEEIPSDPVVEPAADSEPALEPDSEPEPVAASTGKTGQPEAMNEPESRPEPGPLLEPEPFLEPDPERPDRDPEPESPPEPRPRSLPPQPPGALPPLLDEDDDDSPLPEDPEPEPVHAPDKGDDEEEDLARALDTTADTPDPTSLTAPTSPADPAVSLPEVPLESEHFDDSAGDPEPDSEKKPDASGDAPANTKPEAKQNDPRRAPPTRRRRWRRRR